MKNHENQPGTMKNHENCPGTMNNQPGTMKNQSGRNKQKRYKQTIYVTDAGSQLTF